ncbi:MAG: InlB B-repeat-containing protein [Actinomycetota bacterium]
MTTLSFALAVVIPMLAATAPEARAATPSLLLGGPRVAEYQPIRGDNFLAWQQNTKSNPGHYDIYARSLGGGQKFKVNPSGTNGANGDIDGDVLVYQQFEGGKSQLRFFDLVGRTHSDPPPGVNTDEWEYWPSMSGNWLLFGRLYDSGLRRIILFDLSTNTARRLDRSRGERWFLAPGQVSGDYAVWYKCSSDTDCDVFRYHIPDRTMEKIPNQGGRLHAPSVTPDGTVFFARSRYGCGTGVRLIAQPLEGEAVVLWSLPRSGDDIATTKAYVDAQGVTTILFDHFECGEPAVSDAWEIVADLSPQLTVEPGGDGSGTVTSSPAGIDCGTDCQERYDPGTEVTLTANPDPSSTFGGWTNCDTVQVDSTCKMAMSGDKTVTATFVLAPPPVAEILLSKGI